MEEDPKLKELRNRMWSIGEAIALHCQVAAVDAKVLPPRGEVKALNSQGFLRVAIGRRQDIVARVGPAGDIMIGRQTYGSNELKTPARDVHHAFTILDKIFEEAGA